MGNLRPICYKCLCNERMGRLSLQEYEDSVWPVDNNLLEQEAIEVPFSVACDLVQHVLAEKAAQLKPSEVWTFTVKEDFEGLRKDILQPIRSADIPWPIGVCDGKIAQEIELSGERAWRNRKLLETLLIELSTGGPQFEET